MKTELIVKDNALINASYNLDLVEQRLILLAIVEARESGKGINANDPLTVHAESYINQFGVHRNTAYQALKDACDDLFARQFSYQSLSEKGNVINHKSRWVSEVAYIALILLAPSLWASGIALGTGAPIMVQFTESTTQLHATWGMMGVTGTLPHPAALPLALGAVVGTTVILTIGVRDVIKALGTRRASVWVIGSGLILWAIALSTSMVGVRNVVAGTTPPPVVEWIASTLHNGMHASTGAQWAITALVSWPIAMGTLLVVMGVATGLGIAAAGPPSAPWSGQELEDSLRRVYKAGLIDQAAFDRGHYRLSQAKKNAKRPTRHQP